MYILFFGTILLTVVLLYGSMVWYNQPCPESLNDESVTDIWIAPNEASIMVQKEKHHLLIQPQGTLL